MKHLQIGLFIATTGRTRHNTTEMQCVRVTSQRGAAPSAPPVMPLANLHRAVGASHLLLDPPELRFRESCFMALFAVSPKVVSSHRHLTWRSAYASICTVTTKTHARWSGQRLSTKSSKKSVGAGRRCPKHLNHCFVKDTTLDCASSPSPRSSRLPGTSCRGSLSAPARASRCGRRNHRRSAPSGPGAPSRHVSSR